MIRYSWFRLIIRLIGVLLICLSIPSTIEAVGQLIFYFAPSQFGSLPASMIWIFSLFPALAQLIIGLYLLFGGQWLIARCFRGIDTTCPICAYDLSGITSDNCPECGYRFRPIPPLEAPKAPPAQ